MKVRKVAVTRKAPKKPKTAAEIKAHNTASATAKATMAHRTTKQKHASAMKAAATRKKDAAKAKRLGWAPDGDVAICSARAVAESLRLATGLRVPDDDVLALHWLAGGHPDAGASIVATLEAVSSYGLGGVRPVTYTPAGPCGCWCHGDQLILAIDWPEPHAVLATPGGWWSWGQLRDPWNAVIEEAWEVTW